MGKKSAYVGLDPGAEGAICCLVPSQGQAAFHDTTSKPADILRWFKAIQKECDIKVIMIEDVHSIFGASAKSNFNFGYNVGVVNTLARSTEESVDLVQPKKWQKQVGVKTKGKAIKKEVGAICDRLYPKVNIRGPRGGLLDGKSDALMIAHYAYLTYKEHT